MEQNAQKGCVAGAIGKARSASAAMPNRNHAYPFDAVGDVTELYTRGGARKYVTIEERRRFIAAASTLPETKRLFLLMLVWTGARISEVLAIRQMDVQLDRGLVLLRTLKRRRFALREIPLPPALLSALHVFLRSRPCGGEASAAHLWPWCRTTAWRLIRRMMRCAGIHGPQACPRGLRHGFAVAALQSGVPVMLLQRWLGHARLSTTAIYAAVSGPEERSLATDLWKRAA